MTGSVEDRIAGHLGTSAGLGGGAGQGFSTTGWGSAYLLTAGGLAEMSLIALSLHFNPVVVALHHLARIFLTIWIGSFLARYVFKLEPPR